MSMTGVRCSVFAFFVLACAVAAPAMAADAKVPPGEAKAKASDCFSCHAVDHKLVGPGYQDVAKRYAGQGDKIVPVLVAKIKKGGSGNWGSIPMTPHPQLSDADLTEIVHWILSLKPGGTATAKTAPAGQTHSYKNSDGKMVTADFDVFKPGTGDKQVTDDVFKGYEQYNSYCFRCHGGDAIGGEYAPDLRHSLAGGMTWQQFLSTAMAGRQSKGMPSWAGFFEEQDIRDIYEYIKARQLDLIAPGRPPSGQD